MNNQFEKQKDELRNSLSAGGFGSEMELSDMNEADEKVDDALVGNFINGFGSYKHSDFIAHVPGQLMDSFEYSGYLYGISRKETESFYIIDSPQASFPIIGYIANKDDQVPNDIPFGVIIIRDDNGFECKTTDSDSVRIKRYEPVSKTIF